MLRCSAGGGAGGQASGAGAAGCRGPDGEALLLLLLLLSLLVQEAKRAVGSGVKVQYVSLNKDSHVLEVPEVRGGRGAGNRHCAVVPGMPAAGVSRVGSAMPRAPSPALGPLQGAKVPASWEPCASKKGVKRYMSADVSQRGPGTALHGVACRAVPCFLPEPCSAMTLPPIHPHVAAGFGQGARGGI